MNAVSTVVATLSVPSTVSVVSAAIYRRGMTLRALWPVPSVTLARPFRPATTGQLPVHGFAGREAMITVTKSGGGQYATPGMEWPRIPFPGSGRR